MAARRADITDWPLLEAELRVSSAYADALIDPGVLSAAERDQIDAALTTIGDEYAAGSLMGADIFAAIDARLEALVGAPASKLRAGRGRGERLLTALRLWLIEVMATLSEHIADVQRALVQQAEGHVGALMPGYIHFQPVGVVSCGHWLLSYFWMLTRDQERLTEIIGRASLSPMGSGLFAGTPYRIDREGLASAIELNATSQNSLDAVSDWDFAAEFLFVTELLGVHLSRLAADLMLFSSPAYGFASLNAPAIETANLADIRGAAGALNGYLAGLLNTLRALPTGYNQDAGADRVSLYTAADRLTTLIPQMAAIVGTMTLHPDRMWDALDETILSADLASYLVARGVAYAEVESIVGRVMARAEQSGEALSDMALPDFQAESPAFDADVYSVFDFSRSAAERSSTGGTAPGAVRAQIRAANTWLIDAGLA